MKTSELKHLIKEAVREVLKEELAELGKQKIQESLRMPIDSTSTHSNEAWSTINLNTSNTNAAFRQSLMDQMGITPPTPKPITFGEKQNVYNDMLAQVAAEMRQNPGDVNNFKNISE